MKSLKRYRCQWDHRCWKTSRSRCLPVLQRSEIQALLIRSGWNLTHFPQRRPSADSVHPRGNRHLFWSHTRDDGNGLPVFCSDNTFTNASVDDQTRSMGSHEIQCEKGHTNDSVRKDSWSEIQKRDSSIVGTNLCSHG